MKKLIAISSVILVNFLCSCISFEHNTNQERFTSGNDFVILESKNTRNAELNWGGREYVGMFFRKGEDYYLTSSIVDHTDSIDAHSFVQYLGKNVQMISNGLQVENGRLVAEYFNGCPHQHDDEHTISCMEDTKWKKVSVPFGDFYGTVHVSGLLPEDISLEQEYSKKYGIGDFCKVNEPAIESLIPTLKQCLRTDNASAISEMIFYPICVGATDPDGNIIWLENADDFIKYYPQIFCPEKKNQIFKLEDDDLFCNGNGLMLNNGMWLFGSHDGKLYFKKL